MERLDVHVVGLDGDFERAVRALEERFGMPRSAAERFFRTLPRVARHQADREEARAYKRVLGDMGAKVVIRPAGDVMPSSSLLSGDLPSLPVPAHGPTGITPSMQTFASSARLANTVPRAPALPLDLADGLQDAHLETGLDPDEVDLLMSSPFPGTNHSADASIEFTGLSSTPDQSDPGQADSSPSLSASDGSGLEMKLTTWGNSPPSERGDRRRRLSWLAGLLLLSASVAVWAIR